MGDTLIGIIGMVVIFAFIIGVRKLMYFGVRKANQNVFQRRAHQEGEQLVTQPLQFTARAPLDQVRRAILSTVKVAPTVPAIILDAYIAEATDDHITYAYGNKLNRTNFVAGLTFEPVDGGVRGMWVVVNWTKVDGIVDGISVVKRLIADIDTALAKVDPAARLHPLGTSAQQPQRDWAPDRTTSKL